MMGQGYKDLRNTSTFWKINFMGEDLRELNILPFPDWQNIKTNTQLWFDTGHPFYLNRACDICQKFEIPFPTLLIEETLKLGESFRKSEVQSRPKDTKPLRKMANDEAMVFVVNLIFIGATLKEASAKAATWYSNVHPKLPLKTASGIERDYSETWKASGYEKECFEQFKRTDQSNPEWRNAWEEIRRSTPEAIGKLKGNRRNE
ncbi:MAG: hypothetical protein L3J37_10750 [Rhodobacteraceae bacterium]|nr:hypothetical protein [Paracoccaceae bacterium]